MTKRKKSIRVITADRLEKLNRLADILAEFLPLTSRSSSTVTFTSIFEESSVHTCLAGTNNKKQALQKGLKYVYRYHKNLPKLIIRKTIPAAIEYRKHKRYPLTKKELQDLIACLEGLGIDMTSEINKIEVDERLPRITVPPKQLMERLRGHDLDEALAAEPLALFEDGHFNDAIRKTTEVFEDRVQAYSRIDSSGRDLMARALSNSDLVNLAGVEPENQAGFSEGYKFLSMGLMGAVRNVFSHGNEQSRTPEECFEMFLFVNWLLRYLQEN